MNESEASAEAVDTQPDVQAGVEGEATQAPDKGDYLGRIGSDPEFAVETVRSRDKKVSQLNERLGKFEALEAYVDTVGAAGVLEYVDYANKVASNPSLRALVDEAIRTGQVPTAQAETGSQNDDDLFVDPDVKTLREELASTRAEMEGIRSSSNQRLAEAEVAGFKSGISDNIGKVMSEFGVNDDVRDQMAQAIQGKVDMAQRQALNGDASARNLLKTLGGEEGQKTLELVVYDVIKANLGVIAKAKDANRVANAQASSTGDPATSRSAGGDPNALDNDFVRGSSNWVQRELEKATKEVTGQDARSFWR